MRLASRSREGQTPGRLPLGWAPEAERGGAPCNRQGLGPRGREEHRSDTYREAGPDKPRGAGPRATAVELGPRNREGQEVTASPRPSRPTPPPYPSEAPTMGRAGSEFRLTGEHRGWEMR